MKSLTEYVNEHNNINESQKNEFKPNLKTHAEAYNRLLKWYDKSIKHMDMDEAIGCLEYAVEQWKAGNFDDI